jgi:hypothetical protein
MPGRYTSIIYIKKVYAQLLLIDAGHAKLVTCYC